MSIGCCRLTGRPDNQVAKHQDSAIDRATLSYRLFVADR